MRNIRYLIAFLVLLGLCTPASAKVKGQCANCHTMHNSQNNLPVTVDDDSIYSLLLDDCIGCHTGINNGINTTPYVFDPAGPQYKDTGTEADSNTLAGGNFYWVAEGNDRAGHNIMGLAGEDMKLLTPPGGDGSYTGGQLRCAGSMGCHGLQGVDEQIVAMRKSHHFKDHNGWQNGSSLAGSYRFLSSIQGMEDPDYEYRPTDQEHNKYYGEDRTLETDNAEGTISSQCARCHQYFHDGSGSLISPPSSFGSGVWIRHPTDFDMGNTDSGSEYRSYGGTGNLYVVAAPVATADKSTTLNTNIYKVPDDAIVMCLSCHRAHGTPYNGILRWDYKSWPGSGGYNGCAICHTSKD